MEHRRQREVLDRRGADPHLDEVIRGLVSDPSTLAVQPIEEALEEDHRRWYGQT